MRENGSIAPSDAEFKIESKAAKAQKAEALELLKGDSLEDRDALRLTRVLQLIERYKPVREELQDSKMEVWVAYLKSLHRKLPLRKNEKPIRNYSAHSALLAENMVATLKELRRIDKKLEKEPEFTEEEIVNQDRSGAVTNHETINSSLTLDYEKKNWGPERIALDGIQNHLPSDAKGERVLVRFQVGDQWVTLPEAKLDPTKVDAVRFIDDGVGFDVKNLDLLYSTKSDEEDSRGQFGEGMKMMAAAALREGLEPELESQNWRAKPIAKKETLKDTRNRTDRTVERLAFEVDHLDGQPLVGSRTTFWRPSKEFLDEALQIEDKVLALREKYRPAFVGEQGQIVDTTPGKIFVKGIFVKSENTLFSYNFDDVETNRDRNALINVNLESRVKSIISELSSKNLMKALLRRVQNDPNAFESRIYNLNVKQPDLWKEAFYETFGKDAVIETRFQPPEAFKDIKINKVNISREFTDMLLRAGVKSDREAVPNFYEETIDTSLTAEYGKEVWKEERIMLDAVQNHLPSDSGGNNINLRFKTKDGEWHSFVAMPDFPDDEIDAIKIYDNGRGYDYRTLGFFYSGKDGYNSAGKFGEGLKMLSLACLRKDINITLRSRDWEAKPRYQQQKIDGKDVEQLVYDVVHYVGERNNDDKEAWGEKSATIFNQPTAELLSEFREINKKVLAIERPKPIESTNGGDVIALSEGSLYVHDILIPGDQNLLFSYHFPNLDIQNRDRSMIQRSQLSEAVRGVFEDVDSEEVIRSFLYKANMAAREQSSRMENKVEFDLRFQPKDPEQWKRLFQEIFGDKTAIRDVKSQDFDAMGQNEHVGLSLVTFPTGTYETLQRIGLPSYEERIEEITDVNFVPEEGVTDEERKVMEILTTLDKFLPGNTPEGIKLYDKKTPEQVVALGFWGRSAEGGRPINLYREIVRMDNLYQAADVYFHEKTHQNTGGAKDASAEFRNYLTATLAAVGLEQLKKERPDLVD